MEEKIIEYVNYKFRFKKGKDVEETKAEIIANLTDRYYDLLKEGKSMQEAYVEAIKSFGSFSDDTLIDPETKDFNVKPSLADISLIVGTILSVFGVITILFSTIVGVIITMLSIACYAGGAYYLYAYSQYAKLKEFDIEKHNLTLKKIFKYMKTCYVFWAISLSYITAMFASSVVSFFGSLAMFSDPMQMVRLVYVQIIISVLVFILAIVASVLLFSNLYQRLLRKYYQLTGEVYLKSTFREGYEFIYSDDHTDNHDHQNHTESSKTPSKSKYKAFLPVYIFACVSSFFVCITNLFNIGYNDRLYMNFVQGPIFILIFDLLYSQAYLGAIIYIIGIIGFLTTVVFVLLGKINYKWLILADFFWLFCNYVFIANLNATLYAHLNIYGMYIFGLTIIGLITLIVWSVNRSIKRRKIKRIEG